MLTQLNHMVMAVDDLAACRAIYGGPLDLEEIEETADGTACLFRVGPTLLEMRQTLPTPSTGPPVPTEESTRPEVNHIALYVDSIDRAYASLKDGDIGLLGPPAATAVGHRNMQRSLLAFKDPNKFSVQISETIDPRSHLESRREAKRVMAASSGASRLFRGVDHIAMYCTDYSATRRFYGELLGLEEFFHSTTREPGEPVAPGFEQGAFAVGGTDIEMASDDTWNKIGPGAVSQLGFSTADIEETYTVLRDKGIEPDAPPAEWTPCTGVRQRAFTMCDPDGLIIQISQPDNRG